MYCFQYKLQLTRAQQRIINLFMANFDLIHLEAVTRIVHVYTKFNFGTFSSRWRRQDPGEEGELGNAEERFSMVRDIGNFCYICEWNGTTSKLGPEHKNNISSAPHVTFVTTFLNLANVC